MCRAVRPTTVTRWHLPAWRLRFRARKQKTATFWLAVTAFGRQAQALAKHQKGDLVSVAGNMQVNQWTGNDGGTQTGYQVIADSVISARTARPSGKKGQQGQAIDALRRAQEPMPTGTGNEGW